LSEERSPWHTDAEQVALQKNMTRFMRQGASDPSIGNWRSLLIE
jgi:hypothetical protein